MSYTLKYSILSSPIILECSTSGKFDLLKFKNKYINTPGNTAEEFYNEVNKAAKNSTYGEYTEYMRSITENVEEILKIKEENQTIFLKGLLIENLDYQIRVSEGRDKGINIDTICVQKALIFEGLKKNERGIESEENKVKSKKTVNVNDMLLRFLFDKRPVESVVGVNNVSCSGVEDILSCLLFDTKLLPEKKFYIERLQDTLKRINNIEMTRKIIVLFLDQIFIYKMDAISILTEAFTGFRPEELKNPEIGSNIKIIEEKMREVLTRLADEIKPPALNFDIETSEYKSFISLVEFIMKVFDFLGYEFSMETNKMIALYFNEISVKSMVHYCVKESHDHSKNLEFYEIVRIWIYYFENFVKTPIQENFKFELFSRVLWSISKMSTLEGSPSLNCIISIFLCTPGEMRRSKMVNIFVNSLERRNLSSFFTRLFNELEIYEKSREFSKSEKEGISEFKILLREVINYY